jgi:hypothetical protein
MSTRRTHLPTRRDLLRHAAALAGAALLPARLVAQGVQLAAVPL